MYLKNSQVQFELKNKPGMFLMLKEINHSIAENTNITTCSQMNVTTISHEYALVVDYPSEPYLTEWENSGSCGALVQMMNENTNCFIAFDSSGKVAGPCNLSANDPASCISTIPASSLQSASNKEKYAGVHSFWLKECQLLNKCNLITYCACTCTSIGCLCI